MRGLLVAGLIILLIIGYFILRNLSVPSYIGMKNGKFAPLKSSPNGVSSQEKGEKHVEPIVVYGNGEKALKLLVKACQQYGDANIIKQEKEYVHLVFTTGKMKFNDDVQLFYSKDKGIIEYWSQSRTGYSDMGLNLERYHQIIEIYKTMKMEEE